MRIHLLAATFAIASLMGASASAQPALSPATAVENGVSACKSINEGKFAPSDVSAVARREALTANAKAPPLLQEKLFANSSQVDWWGRPVSAGTLLIAVDKTEPSCSVFLLGVPGTAVIADLVPRLSGWEEAPIDTKGARAFLQTLPDGRQLALSLHDGGAITVPEAIGILARLWILE